MELHNLKMHYITIAFGITLPFKPLLSRIYQSAEFNYMSIITIKGGIPMLQLLPVQPGGHKLSRQLPLM